MKKTILYFVLFGLLFTFTDAYAADTQSKIEIDAKKTETVDDDSIVIYETSLIKIIKKDNKYGVYDKKNSQYFVKPVLDEISKFTRNNDFEYKIKAGDMLGYMNLVSRDTFLSYFDDISIINNKYLRIKKDGKVGISDKTGKVILPPEYQKVSVTQYDDIEYLVAKDANNKHNVFYNDGTIVSDEDLYSINKTTFGSSIVKDLKPVLQDYRDSLKKYRTEKKYVAENDTITLEIPESPTLVAAEKKANTALVQIKDDSKSSIVSVNFDDEEQVVEVGQLYPMPRNVQKLSVKQEDYNTSPAVETRTYDAVDVITLNNKSYYITNNEGKLGLQTKHGREIIPARYNALKVKTIDKKDSQEIIAALAGKNSKLYNTSGEVLAKRFHGKINVYTSMRKYEYAPKGISSYVYDISFNDRKVGEIKVHNDGTYTYTRTGFNLSNMKKANELFVTLVNAEK